VAEWKNADSALSTLSKFGIPYTWCAGNHDDFSNGDPTSGWIGSKNAPSLDPSVVSARVNLLPYASWAGDYHDAMNTALTFAANGLNFLVINLEWNAEPDALTWAGGILDNPKYAYHHVIIAPHAYMDQNGNMDDAKWGAMTAKFVDGLTPLMDAHPSNVFLTLNGHFATDSGYNTPDPINGRNQLMFDRQDSTDNPALPTGRGVDDADMTADCPDSDRVGGATITVLTFDTANNQIRARTHDVYSSNWRDNQFERYAVTMFPLPMKLRSERRLVPSIHA